MSYAELSQLGRAPSEGDEFDEEDGKNTKHGQRQSPWLNGTLIRYFG
jgi:hypothetical protein